MYLFLIEYEIANGLLIFWKTHMPGKNSVLELWSKNLYINKNKGFFNHSIS